MQLKTFCPFPIGGIYLAVDSTDPATMWSDTSWQRIQDCMLMAAGSTYAAGTTGGAANHSLTIDELPSHTHSVGAHAHGLNSHVHSVGAHSHGLNSHTHTYAKVNTPTGGTAITTAQLPSHTHGIKIRKCGKEASGYGLTQTAGFSGRVFIDSGVADWNTESAGSGNTHSHTIATTSTNSGAATGSTANSTAFNSGAASGNTANSSAFDSGSTGGGLAFSVLNPYLAVYVWKRVA